MYLHCLERQNILATNNTLKTTKKIFRLVWQTIKGIINMKKGSDKSISSLLIDGEIISSAKEIFNYFNNFSVFYKCCRKNKNIAQKLIEQHIFLSPTLPEDTDEGIIKSMKTNKTNGPNSIPTKICGKANNISLIL